MGLHQTKNDFRVIWQPKFYSQCNTALTQSVECGTFNPKVKGSNPLCGMGRRKEKKMLCGAGEARWAHNPKVGGSKPLGAN